MKKSKIGSGKMIELIVLLTVFTYGTNFVLYLILKNKKSMPIVEKASIV